MKRTQQSGFTILEVLLAMVLLAIGLVAMMAMQVTFIQSTSQSQDIAVGTLLGERTVEGLQAESTNWNTLPTNRDLAMALVNTGSTLDTSNLLRLSAGGGTWVSLYQGRPLNNEGLPYTAADDTLNARYCVDGRMVAGNTVGDVMVGEVRVAWPTDNKAAWLVDPSAGCGNSLANVVYNNGVPATGYNVVYIPFTLRRRSI